MFPDRSRQCLGIRPFPPLLLWNDSLELVLRTFPLVSPERAGRGRENCLIQDVAQNAGPSRHVEGEVRILSREVSKLNFKQLGLDQEETEVQPKE